MVGGLTLRLGKPRLASEKARIYATADKKARSIVDGRRRCIGGAAMSADGSSTPAVARGGSHRLRLCMAGEATVAAT